MKYFIFDFDGVLGDTFDCSIEVKQAMDGKSREEVLISHNEYFTKSTHTRDLNLNEESLRAMKEWVIEFGNAIFEKDFNLFTGFIEELKKIKNTKMAVVSSGSAIYIKPKLENCGVKFSPILTFEDHHSKEEKVEMICREWKVEVKDVYFFTDTISDVRELEKMLDKNKLYGCAWGYQGREKLLTVLESDHILDNFSDIKKIK